MHSYLYYVMKTWLGLFVSVLWCGAPLWSTSRRRWGRITSSTTKMLSKSWRKSNEGPARFNAILCIAFCHKNEKPVYMSNVHSVKLNKSVHPLMAGNQKMHVIQVQLRGISISIVFHYINTHLLRLPQLLLFYGRLNLFVFQNFDLFSNNKECIIVLSGMLYDYFHCWLIYNRV